jgi:hypothetical protein
VTGTGQYTTSHPPQTVAKQVRRHSAGNIALAVVLLGLTLGAYLIGAVFDILSLAIRGGDGEALYNPTALIGGGAALALVALVGAAVTVLLIAQRRRAWPAALVTFLVVVVGWVVVFVLFAFSFA